jgi:hypothetical protein
VNDAALDLALSPERVQDRPEVVRSYHPEHTDDPGFLIETDPCRMAEEGGSSKRREYDPAGAGSATEVLGERRRLRRSTPEQELARLLRL